MSKRIHIDCIEIMSDGNHVDTRRLVCISQGDWFYPILHFKAPAKEPVEFANLVAYCRETGRDEVLERLYAKAELGGDVHLDDRVVGNAELRVTLATGPET